MSGIADFAFGGPAGMVTGLLEGPPDAPNPTQSAQAQMDINRQAAYDSAALNQINQVGPGFNISYTGEIGDPNRTMTYSLSQPRQQLADMLNQKMIDVSGGLNTNYIDPSIRAGEAADTMFDALSSRLGRFQQREFDRTNNMLTQRGLPIGGKAWNDVMGDLSRSQTDQQLQIANAAEMLGINESNRLFGQDMATRQDARSLLGAMLAANPENLAQLPQLPAFQISPADLMGAQQMAYQGEMNNYNATMGGLANLGSSAMMLAAFSHPDFKRDFTSIETILPRIDALKVEAWRYKPEMAALVPGGSEAWHIGPYADQFQQLFGLGDGVRIDLQDAVGILFAAVKELHAKLKMYAEPVS